MKDEHVKFRRSCRRLLRSKRGVVAVMFALCMPVFVAFAALSIDMSYIFWTRNWLQVTASAAALAASKNLPNEADAVAAALEYAEKNMAAARHGPVLVEVDVITGDWDADTRTFTPGTIPATAVRVTTRKAQVNGNELNLFFAPALGMASTNISTSAVATFKRIDPWDMMIVQDVTHSFGDELGDARAADQALLGCLRDFTSRESQVGLTTFTGFAFNTEPLQAIGDNFDRLSQSISDFDKCDGAGMPPCTGTHVGAGLESAIAQFTDPAYVPATNLYGQAIVIVGDGAPYYKPSAEASYQASQNLFVCDGSCDDYLELAEMKIDAANAADDLGISVFTVFFDENDDDLAAAFFEDLVRGDGVALRTPVSAELSDLLLGICTNLPHLLVD